MVSQEWLDGLLNGEIAEGQGGLTQGQLGWLETHRQAQVGAEDADIPVRTATRPRSRRRPAARKSTPAQFNLADTEEL
jgi:hypothetical protein